MTLQNERELLRTPVCIGMPRSASRMTWQVVKSFLPPEPINWQEYTRSNIPTSLLESGYYRGAPWPPRSHDFVAGKQPVVYSYRDPVEAYLSLLVRGKKEVTRKDCAKEILLHSQIQEKLKVSQKSGRKVLWLKYEKYFKNDRKRVEEVSKFLNMKLTALQKENILNYVNLDTNLKRSKQFPRHETENTFRTWEDVDSGIQAYHINENTKGEIGKYFKLYPDELKRVLDAPKNTILGQLTLFAQSLNYTY